MDYFTTNDELYHLRGEAQRMVEVLNKVKADVYNYSILLNNLSKDLETMVTDLAKVESAIDKAIDEYDEDHTNMYAILDNIPGQVGGRAHKLIAAANSLHLHPSDFARRYTISNLKKLKPNGVVETAAIEAIKERLKIQYNISWK